MLTPPQQECEETMTTSQRITYQLQYRKCGKSSCGTCKHGAGHGPYWYAYWREDDKLRSKYLGMTPPVEVDAATITRLTERAERYRVAATMGEARLKEECVTEEVALVPVGTEV